MRAFRQYNGLKLVAGLICGLVLAVVAPLVLAQEQRYDLNPSDRLPSLMAPTPNVRVSPNMELSTGLQQQLQRAARSDDDDEGGDSVRRVRSGPSVTGDRHGNRARSASVRQQRDRDSGNSAEDRRRSRSNRDSAADRRRSRRRQGSTEPAPTTNHTMVRAPGAERGEDAPVEYGRLIVITQFDGIRITVAGQPYPRGSEEGVLLIAGEQYDILFEATEDGSSLTRAINVRLGADETRVLMANLGAGSTPTATPRDRERPERSSRRSRDDDDDEEIGYLGVSSSPRGTVYVDGENTGQVTPARRIELEPGRHEVRIFYDSEDRFSETKNVLIRAGVNTNVFFRLRDDEDEGDDD